MEGEPKQALEEKLVFDPKAASAIINRNPALVVIENLLEKFIPYRGLAPHSEDGAPRSLSRDAIVRDLDQLEYVRVTAKRVRPRGQREVVLFFVLAQGGKYMRHSPDLRKLLEGVRFERATKEGRLDEVMLIAEDEFFEKKNVMEVVREFQADEARGADPEGVGAFYTAHPYCNFITVIPECDCVFPHRIMAPEEAERYMAWHRIKPASLPLIQDDDPPVVWLGAREGEFVHISRDSETAMLADYVRRVVRAPRQESKSSRRSAGRGERSE